MVGLKFSQYFCGAFAVHLRRICGAFLKKKKIPLKQRSNSVQTALKRSEISKSFPTKFSDSEEMTDEKKKKKANFPEANFFEVSFVYPFSEEKKIKKIPICLKKDLEKWRM
jgi:hypothetical protein